MSNAQTARVVMVIEDPKRGDFANVLALGQLIADRLGARVEVKRLAPRSMLLLPLLRLAVRMGARGGVGRSHRRALQRLFFTGSYIGDSCPVAVVSTLGRGEAQGAFVGSFWKVPAIHLGTPKRLAARCFSAIVTHACDTPKKAEVALTVAPTRIRLQVRAKPSGKDGIARLCLLLGGDAAGVARYEPRFWLHCVQAAMATARAHGAQLAISTSPRSGAVVEDIVETAVAAAPLPVPDLCLYGRGDRRDITPMISAADAVLVTSESISMMSDAIASGARVIGLFDTALPTSRRVRAFLDSHRAAGTIRLADMAEWNGAALSLAGIRPLATCWSETLWPALEPVVARRAPRLSPELASS